MSFAGIITDVQHRIDKNGNPYGVFVVEDFTDSKDLWFRDDYLNLNDAGLGAFVYLKARVQNRPERSIRDKNKIYKPVV